jgi:hypothetical protein
VVGNHELARLFEVQQRVAHFFERGQAALHDAEVQQNALDVVVALGAVDGFFQVDEARGRVAPAKSAKLIVAPAFGQGLVELQFQHRVGGHFFAVARALGRSNDADQQQKP